MATINFGGVDETVITRDEFPLEKALDVLGDETIAVLGYGVQGPGQALNMRDNGFRVIVGQRRDSASWVRAVRDGWVEGETLFSIEEAARRGTIICNLLSDAGQIALWPTLQAAPHAGQNALLLPRLRHHLQGKNPHHPAPRRGRDSGGAQGQRHEPAPPVRGRWRAEFLVCRVPGRYRPRLRQGSGDGHWGRVGLLVRDGF